MTAIQYGSLTILGAMFILIIVEMIASGGKHTRDGLIAAFVIFSVIVAIFSAGFFISKMLGAP